jgi:hypothetical protein
MFSFLECLRHYLLNRTKRVIMHTTLFYAELAFVKSYRHRGVPAYLVFFLVLLRLPSFGLVLIF